MSEHLPETLIGQTLLAYCDVCEKNTNHRVDRVAVGSHAGKIGPCLENHVALLTKRQEKTRQQLANAQRQPGLFRDPR
jgi:ribosomal protein L44E